MFTKIEKQKFSDFTHVWFSKPENGNQKKKKRNEKKILLC